MFQSVVEQPGWRNGRFGTGAGVSLLVHMGIFAAALFLSAGVAKKVQEDPELVIRLVQQPPRGNPEPAPVNPPEPRPKPKDPNPVHQRVAVSSVKPDEAEPSPPPDEEPDSNNLPHVPGSHPDGVDKDGIQNLPVITGLERHLADMVPTGEDVLAFSNSMKKPELLSAPSIQYTREALEARVEGLLSAKCVITREGDVEKCRIIKGLPHMDEAVLSALEARRYRPVEYMGKPVSVSYVFHVRLEIPR